MLRWVLGHLHPHRFELAILALLSLAEVVFRAANPWALKSLIDYAVIGADMPDGLAAPLSRFGVTSRDGLLLTFVASSAAIQLAHHFVLMHHGRVQARAAQQLVLRLRQHLFAHVQSLALAHHTRTPTGATVYHLESDAACLEHLIFRGLFPVAFSILTLLVMFGTLAHVDPLLALTAVSIVPALHVAVRLHARALASRAARVKQIESRVTGHLHETIAGIALTKSFARERYEAHRFTDRASEAVDARIDLATGETRFAFTVGAITAVGGVVTLGVGGWRVLDGHLTIGTLLVVLAYIGFVYGPMSVIANVAGTLQSALVSARRVRETLSLPMEQGGGHGPAAPIRGEVRFEDVTFAYGDTPVLEQVSFTARPGELVAVVGPSGAGKTTLLTLINRFNDPAVGRVLLDGVDVRELPLDMLRASVSVVLQEAILISGTVAENIRYGRLDATDAEVEAAARAAHAHEFVCELPEGYQTGMDKAGASLSGGQRQRLSIARAFLKPSPLLILDEPTSALDPVSESLVLDALRRLRHGRTTFVIAHRLSTVRDADRILVLDRGRLVAQGRHDELMRTCAVYRRMTRLFAAPTERRIGERRRHARRRDDRAGTVPDGQLALPLHPILAWPSTSESGPAHPETAGAGSRRAS